MRDVLTAAFMMLGGLLMLLAAVGVVRMPDVYTRMHAATKPVILGAGCILIAVAVYFHLLGVSTRALLIVFFLLLTAPVSAHIIGRAAYFVGAPLWEGTIRDELSGRYDPLTHRLRSPAPAGELPPVEARRPATGSSVRRGSSPPRTE